MSSGLYKASPAGEAIHPWLTKPDTKYNTTGVYHVKQAIEGPPATDLMLDIKAQSEAAFAAEVEKKAMKPAEAKKWSVYLPYEVEEDDEGTATGRIIFAFKQNAQIRLSDGSIKQFQMGIRDAKDNPVSGVSIFGGSVIRVLYKPRPIVMSGVKQIGVRLDFSMVQIIELAKAQAKGGGGFGEAEGGYVHQGADTNDTGSDDAEY